MTWLPRKPTPLGFEFKSLVDATSGIMLVIEMCEGKDVDSTKQWFAEFGATTATTLRLTKKYHHTGKEIIGDAWFGS